MLAILQQHVNEHAQKKQNGNPPKLIYNTLIFKDIVHTIDQTTHLVTLT